MTITTLFRRLAIALFPRPRRVPVVLPVRTPPVAVSERVRRAENVVAYCVYRLRFEYDPTRGETEATARLRRILAGAVESLGRAGG